MAAKNLKIDQLELDLWNPRINKAEGQYEVMQRIIEDQDIKLAILAESIAEEGSVLIWFAHPWIAPRIADRSHSETVCRFAFAAASTPLRSSALRRTRTVVDFACPFGSLGRPTGFGLGFGSGTVLLNKCGADSKQR